MAALALSALGLPMMACSDYGDRAPYPGGYGHGGDGGACVAGYGGGGYGCCVDKRYALAVEVRFTGGGGLQDLDVQLGAQDRIGVSSSATPPAPGTPGAAAYWVATLEDASGTDQTSLVFKGPDPSYADGGYGHASRVQFALPLPAGAVTLHLQRWDSGQVLIDLDLRGHLQLLCVDRPCLSLCSGLAGTPSVDGGAPPDGAVVDAGVVDAPGPAPVATTTGRR